MSTARLSLLTLILVAAVGLAGCGGADDAALRDGDQPSQDAASNVAELQHIHGLGIEPGGDTLFVATHTGLFTSGAQDSGVQRVGTSRQDVMGFSVVGPDRFLGSGHPDPADPDLPPNLGLIESRDGGKTWEPISLLGEADFHVLESSGRQVYGFDGTRGRLMVSRDGGRSWAARTPPAAIFALAIDPDDPAQIVASTASGIYRSDDEGKAWRPVRSDLAGLLAWPGADRLYLLDGTGQVLRSNDAGRNWLPAGTIGAPPAAFTADGADLYAALGDGSVKRSSDAGRTWTVRATP